MGTRINRILEQPIQVVARVAQLACTNPEKLGNMETGDVLALRLIAAWLNDPTASMVNSILDRSEGKLRQEAMITQNIMSVSVTEAPIEAQIKSAERIRALLAKAEERRNAAPNRAPEPVVVEGTITNGQTS